MCVCVYVRRLSVACLSPVARRLSCRLGFVYGWVWGWRPFAVGLRVCLFWVTGRPYHLHVLRVHGLRIDSVLADSALVKLLLRRRLDELSFHRLEQAEHGIIGRPARLDLL